MTKSKSKQLQDQPKTHDAEQPEGSAKSNVPTKASEWRLPEGFKVVDDKPESHIFVGGLPGKPFKGEN